MNHNTKEPSFSGKQEPANLESHEQKSTPPQPSSIVEVIFLYLRRNKWRHLAALLVVVTSILFAVWCSLPDQYKIYILPSLLRQQDLDSAELGGINEISDVPTETSPGSQVSSDANKAYVRSEGRETLGFSPLEMVEIPNKEFFIGKYEVTNQQYREFLNENPNYGQPSCWNDRRFNTNQQPVVGVSWYDAKAYCDWLSAKTNERYDLPTKNQWDAAAGYSGNNKFQWEKTRIDKNIVNIGNANDRPLDVNRPLAEKTEQGVRDMAGNVAEWCSDEYHEGRRIVRGGSWSGKFSDAAYYSYTSYTPETRKDNSGFRVVRLK